MRAARLSGEVANVPTIRKRRRCLSNEDALAIRDLTMLEMQVVKELSVESIAYIWGKSIRTVQYGIERAKEAARNQARQDED